MPWHLCSFLVFQDYPFAISATRGIPPSCSKTSKNLDWLLIGWQLPGLPTKQETIEGQNNELAVDQ